MGSSPSPRLRRPKRSAQPQMYAAGDSPRPVNFASIPIHRSTPSLNSRVSDEGLGNWKNCRAESGSFWVPSDGVAGALGAALRSPLGSLLPVPALWQLATL